MFHEARRYFADFALVLFEKFPRDVVPAFSQRVSLRFRKVYEQGCDL